MIEEIVCSYFSITEAEMMLKTRKVEFCRPRQVAMYFYRLHTKYSLARIGMIFGKDHATVLHSCETINNLIDTEKEFALKIGEMNDFIQGAIEFEKQKAKQIKTAQDYYETLRKQGMTEDITTNESPDYSQPFYQNIFRLMEGYATYLLYNKNAL